MTAFAVDNNPATASSVLLDWQYITEKAGIDAIIQSQRRDSHHGITYRSPEQNKTHPVFLPA